MQMYKESKLFKYSLILGILIFVFYFISFISHGFDLEDEGYYFLGYNNAQQLSFNISGFHAIIRILPSSCDVVINRIERLILHIVVSFFFAYSIKKNLLSGIQFSIVFFWILLGNFMSYAYSPISLSYNTINLFLMQILTGVLLFYLNKKIVNWYLNALVLLLSVFLFSIMVFNKLTSSVLFAFSIIIVNSIIESNFKIKYLIKVSSVFVLGGFLALLLYLVVYDFPLSQFYRYLLTSYNYDVYPKHDLIFHFKQLLISPIYEGKFLLVFVFGMIVILMSKTKNLLGKFSFYIYEFSILIILILAGLYYIDHYYFGFGSEFYFIIVFYLSIINYKHILSLDRSKKTIMLFLFFLPIIGFFGSDVSPFEGYNHYAVFYFVIIMLVSFNINSYFLKTLPIFFVSILILRCIFFPFGTDSVLNQNMTFSVKDNTTINIDKSTLLKVEELNKLLNKCSVNKNILFINVSPGLVFLSGNCSLYNPYYNNALSFSSYIKCLKLKKLPNVFYIVRRYGLMDIKYDLYRNFVNDLLNYKTEYIYVGDKYEIIKYTTAK